MNCLETEQTKSCVSLSAMFISVLGFNVHFQISLAEFTPNRKAFIATELLTVKDVETLDAWAVKISIQHVAVGMPVPGIRRLRFFFFGSYWIKEILYKPF